MKIKAIIVDDEFLDREVLHNLINQYCSNITVCALTASVADAISQINIHQPDVVFLDVNMPEVGGLALIDHFPNRHFHVIFTTGSEEYGIKAVKAEAIDYLLKPIDVDELLASEQKLLKHSRLSIQPSRHLRVFTGGEHLLVNVIDIVCIEAEGSYVKVYLSDKRTVIISRNLKQVLTEVGGHSLQRVHRSFVVNNDHIVRYQVAGNEINLFLTNDIVAKVSRRYRKQLKNVV